MDLERLPYNRDYKGILGNVLSICKVGRPKYRCRLIQMPEAEAQKFSLVPSKAALPGTEELLWEAAVSPLMPVDKTTLHGKELPAEADVDAQGRYPEMPPQCLAKPQRVLACPT